jgi:uncharacterized membrane protein
MKTPPSPNGAINRFRNFLVSGGGLTLALFILIHGFIFGFLFHLYLTGNIDISIYFADASKLASGLLPYRDFTLEYPPLSLIFFGLPRIITSSDALYTKIFQYEVLVFDIIGLLLIFDIARRLGEPRWKALSIYTLGVLAIGPIIIQTFDIIPAVMTLAAIYLFWLGNHKASWAVLALGTLTMIYPIVIAPIFLLIYFKNRQLKQIRDGVVTFLAVCVITILPFVILGSGSILNLVSYHSQRGVQIESTYSAIVLALAKLGFTTVGAESSFGSLNIVNPAATVLAKVSPYIMVVSLLIVYWFIYRQVKPGKSQFTRLGAYALLTLATTMATSKVLSPQYFIWLIPIFPLICGRWRTPILATFVLIGGLTYDIFPLHYSELGNFQATTVAILVARDILLVLLAVLAVVSLKRMKASNEPSRPLNARR